MPNPLHQGISDIIKQFELPIGFSKKVIEESERLPATIDPSEKEKRIDLRNEVTVTIDGETAKDFDDAVSVRELPHGGFVLKVSIADVSHFVQPGSVIDREAYERGTSTYFPDRVIPMLPERLSNGLCSLVPHEDRLTFTAEMEFDDHGRRQSCRFYRSMIRSAARLTYTKVAKILGDRDETTRAQYHDVVPHLELMGQLALKLTRVRQERGSLDFDLPEPLIDVDLEEGRIDNIIKAERNLAHRLIEEFMIAANEAVAEFVTEQGVGMIYRVHDRPDAEKVRDFALMLHNLGYAFRMGKSVSSQSLIDVIETVRGKKEERLVNTLLLRTMRQAIYDSQNIGHFGLASQCYTHFTSPIRRYPDLMVHRILANVLSKSSKGKKTPKAESPLCQMANHCSERERNSMKAEWASRDLASAIFMKGKIGEICEGIIASVTKFGFFVELIPYFVEGLVSLRNLKDDYYIFHEKSHLLVGRRTKKKYQIGNPVKVKINGVNLHKRWIDFEVLS